MVLIWGKRRISDGPSHSFRMNVLLYFPPSIHIVNSNLAILQPTCVQQLKVKQAYSITNK